MLSVMSEIDAKIALKLAESSLEAAMKTNEDPAVAPFLKSTSKALAKLKRSMNWL